MRIGIDAQTFVIEHLAIRALSSADKEYEVVLGGKHRDVWHTVGYRTADGVEGTEGGVWRDMLLDIFDDAMELVKRLGGLRIRVDVARKIQLADFGQMLHDNGIGMGLSHQSQHLGMASFAKDDDLGITNA